mgnify:CR=1 FL=1
MAFNLVITPLFWYFEAPIFAGLNWYGYDLYLRTVYAAHHVLPLVCSVTDLALTQQYYRVQDWPIILCAGIFYSFANALGTY